VRVTIEMEMVYLTPVIVVLIGTTHVKMIWLDVNSFRGCALMRYTPMLFGLSQPQIQLICNFAPPLYQVLPVEDVTLMANGHLLISPPVYLLSINAFNN
jgi:hypothetical protein